MGQDIKEHHNLNTHHPGKCLGDFYNPREATTWIELPQHWCQHSWQLKIYAKIPLFGGGRVLLLPANWLISPPNQITLYTEVGILNYLFLLIH